VQAWLINFLAQVSIASSLLFIPLFAKELGASDIEIGLITSFYSLAILTSSGIFGRLSDIYSKKLFLTLGLLLSSFSFFAQCFARDPVQLLVIRTLVGFSIGIFPAALTAYAYKQNRKIGHFTSFGSLGWAIGQLFAGIIAVYCGIFIFGALLFLLSFFMVIREEIPDERIPRSRSTFKIIRENLSVYFAFFIRHTGASAVWLIFPLYLFQLGISKFWIGAIYFANSFLQFLLMPRMDRFNPYLLLNLGAAFSGLTFIFYSLATEIYQFLAIQILIAFGWSAMYVGALRIALEKNIEKSSVVGFLNSTIYLSTIIGSIIGGFIAENFGYSFCFLFGALLSFLVPFFRVRNGAIKSF